MKKHSHMLMSGKKAPAKQPYKTQAQRVQEARAREERSVQAAIRLARALGLPTRPQLR